MVVWEMEGIFEQFESLHVTFNPNGTLCAHHEGMGEKLKLRAPWRRV
jgi:hypothetical protein